MLAENLLDIVNKNVSERLNLKVSTLAQPGVWLQLDSYAMVQAISHLAGLLKAQTETTELLMTITCNDRQECELAVAWQNAAADQELIDSWQTTPLITDNKGNLLDFRDTVKRLSGTITELKEQDDQCSGVLVTFPPIDQDRRLAIQNMVEHRPVSYEFDLFNRADLQELGQTPLNKLTYVVFDTETTGLNPSQGDEIIQLGAIRIVNGQILYHEVIDQLVDPKRFVPPESVAIHGIEPALLKASRPSTRFCRIFTNLLKIRFLVAHNAAFDMRFLELQEEKTGLVFNNPVLDTLLLSSIVHPNQESHSLEGLAERLNVTIVGRHTALGDAIVTAEVLVKLFALLEAHEIYTLADALTASSQSPFAKVAY